MRALWLVFLPVLLFAQSSIPPHEHTPVTGENTVTTAKSEKNGTRREGRGAPEPSVVPGSDPTQSDSDIALQSAKSNPPGKPSTPDPIVRYTFWLVIVGALQFVALVIQAVFLYKAFRETTTATGLTAQALVEAQRSNAANEALTLESNASAKAATELTRQSLMLTHRPRLIVRNVVVPQFLQIPDVFPARIKGTLRITNVGDGPAQVLLVVAEVVFGSSWPNLPITPTVSKEAPVLFSLLPGVYGTRSFQSDKDIDRSEYDRVFGGTPATFIQGYIAYTDDMGNFRSTSFCRWWMAIQRKFAAPEGNEDLENAD